MERDSADDEPDRDELERAGNLGEHDEADEGRRCGQEGDEERVGRAGHSRHRELVAHVGDDRRGDADAEPGTEGHRIDERVACLHDPDRGHGDQRDQHRGGEPVDPAEALQADARLSLAELGRRVNLSAPAVAERLQRLEASGVIGGYHASVDPKAIGYPLAAIVRIAPATRQLERIRELARETPEVVECHRITGEDCYFVKLHLRSIDDLEPILDRFTPYGRTTTSLIHSSPVERRPLPLPES